MLCFSCIIAHGDLDRLAPHLEPIPLEFKQQLYEMSAPIHYAYFPRQGVLSAVTVMEDGASIEVNSIGNEGMAGLPIFAEAKVSPHRVIVQVAGEGLRIRGEILAKEALRSNAFRQVLFDYQTAFVAQISQSVACNGLHSIQKRCCRWLLITHDRVQADVLPLTHEFLAMMLGVRRASVTNVLNPLEERGLIQASRGKVTIRNRQRLEEASCECYRSVADEFDRLFGVA